MELFLTVVLAGLVCCTNGQRNNVFTDDELATCFDTVPNEFARVEYNDTLTRKTVIIDDKNQGVTLPATTTEMEPNVTFSHKSGRYYAVLFICLDQDACTKKTVLRWYVINIPDGDVDSGETENIYTPPDVDPDESFRCIIVVAEQSRKIKGKGSELSNTPIIGQTLNTLDPQDIPDLIRDDDLTVTAFSAFKTLRALPPT